MQAKSQRPKGRDGAISSLNMAIDGLNLAKEVASLTPAKAVFGSVSILLVMIRDTMANERDCVELGLACAGVCNALNRGMGGKRLDQLNRSVCEAIEELTTTVVEIQRKIIEKRDRNPLSQFAHAKNDKEIIAAWRLDLLRILQVFNTELALNTHGMVSDMHHNMSRGYEDAGRKNQAAQTRGHGESPPSPPRVFFGRDALIEKIVGLVENLTPVALIGAGGIGKTSIALTVLYHDRIKRRFGEDRRFIRCDQFPATPAQFLAQLSKATGAGVENPEDLASLHPFLSSKEMAIVIDNAESILDPQGTHGQEIYNIVEELSRLETICLCITSRISTTPPDCETLIIPTLSMKAACDTFYRIYKHDERSDSVGNILEQLDFHPLSITLLATVAHHNQWDTDRLSSEWENRRTDVLQTVQNKSLAATIELSLTSPMFQDLGPDARELLGVVAFFPQGVDQNNTEWLFPAILNRTDIFDKFRILSLTYQSNGFITMLSPLRDYLCPKDPKSSPLLCTTKDHYFSRLSVEISPSRPGFKEGRWIMSEDVNVEHLLNVFISIDAESADAWDICDYFMEHLYWHKKRVVSLGPKIEELRDDHPSKPQGLVSLSRLFEVVGNSVERKRLLVHALVLWRERRDDYQVAQTLESLSDANRRLRLYKEGIQQAEEALDIYKRLGDTEKQAKCLNYLVPLLYDDGQLDAAEKAASRAIDLFPETGQEFLVCQCHRFLGNIYRSKGKKEKAIHHYETALGIASSSGWDNELFWIHYSLAWLFYAQGRPDDANTHVERAKPHAVDDAYSLGRAMEMQAEIWLGQRRFEEAKSEALRAADVFEKLGAAQDLERCKKLLQQLDKKMNSAWGTGWWCRHFR